jgi:pyruvate dehydrogenase (quinone)
MVVMVLNNRDLNLVSWEQRAAGAPKYEASQELPDFPYARFAELLGLEGMRVDRAEDVGPAWDRALAARRPVVVEMVTDPGVPPLPPDVSLKEMKAYLSSMVHGDPEVRRTAIASARQWWATTFGPR